MAAPVRSKFQSKGPPGKDAAAKGAPARPGPKRPVDPEDVPPAAPTIDKRARLLKFGLIGAAAFVLLATAGAGLYVVLSADPAPTPLTIDDISPPAPAPRPVAIGPVRQGDLNDELWRRMGVRPDAE
jgi:hypothetical protein